MKANPVRAPREFVVRDNVPPGGRVVLRPELVKEMVRMFGEAALRRAAEVRERGPA
jgi:hypothetical protein